MLYPDGEGQLNVYAMLQNYFQGPVIQVIVKPHGNSSCNKPIFHTSKEECQRLALQHTPSEAVAIMINDCGGEVHVQGAGLVGHDQMHIKNFKERVLQKRTMPFMQCCWNVNSHKVKLIQFGRNLREKLWHLGIPKNVADQFVRDVMRSHHGGTYEGWLVA